MLDFREVLRSLLPRGQAWDLKPLGFFDLTLGGIGDALEEAYEELKKLASVRDPDKTDFLSDLEKEFGIYPPANASEEQRRQNVAAVAFATPGMGLDHLQEKLRSAGFTNAYVYHNNPAVDPNYYLNPEWSLVCGHQDAILGHRDAYCGRRGFDAYLLVNGPTYSPDNGGLYEYTMPGGYSEALNPWHLVFFVGGLKVDASAGWFSIDDWDMEELPGNLLLDGDAEADNTYEWEALANSVVSKESGTRTGGSGSTVLRVTSSSSPTEIGAVPVTGPTLVEGTEYRVHGWVRCFGTNTNGMSVYVGAVEVFSAAASETWTEFDVDHTPATDGTLSFEASVSSYDSEFYVEFDDITVWPTADEPEGTPGDGLDYWTAGNSAELAKVEGGP